MSNQPFVNPIVQAENEEIIATFQAALDAALSEAQKKDRDNNNAQTELAKLKSNWEQMKHYVHRLETKVTNFEKDQSKGEALELAKIQIIELKDDLQNKKLKRDWWKLQAGEVAKRYKDLKSINLTQEEKIKRLTFDLTQEREKSTPGVITADFLDMNVKYSELQEIIAEKEGELRGRDDKFQALSQEFQSEKERREELESLVQKGYDHVKKLEEDVEVLREELRETLSALKDEQKLSKTLESLNQGLKTEFDTAQTQLSKSLSAIESQGIKVSAKESRILELENDLTNAKTNQKETQNEIQTLRRDLIKIPKLEQIIAGNILKFKELEKRENAADFSRREAEERLEASKIQSLELQKKLDESHASMEKLASDVAIEREDLQNAFNGVRHESLEFNGLLKAKLMELERIIGPFKDQLEAYDEESSKWRYFLDETEAFSKQIEGKCSNAIRHQKNQQRIQYLVQLEEALLSTGKAREELQKEVNRVRKELGDLNSSANRKFSPAKAF